MIRAHPNQGEQAMSEEREITPDQIEALREFLLHADDDWLLLHCRVKRTQHRDFEVLFDKVNEQEMEWLFPQPPQPTGPAVFPGIGLPNQAGDARAEASHEPRYYRITTFTLWSVSTSEHVYGDPSTGHSLHFWRK
jgi:hypothetical protein